MIRCSHEVNFTLWIILKIVFHLLFFYLQRNALMEMTITFALVELTPFWTHRQSSLKAFDQSASVKRGFLGQCFASVSSSLFYLDSHFMKCQESVIFWLLFYWYFSLVFFVIVSFWQPSSALRNSTLSCPLKMVWINFWMKSGSWMRGSSKNRKGRSNDLL